MHRCHLILDCSFRLLSQHWYLESVSRLYSTISCISLIYYIVRIDVNQSTTKLYISKPLLEGASNSALKHYVYNTHDAVTDQTIAFSPYLVRISHEWGHRRLLCRNAFGRCHSWLPKSWGWSNLSRGSLSKQYGFLVLSYNMLQRPAVHFIRGNIFCVILNKKLLMAKTCLNPAKEHRALLWFKTGLANSEWISFLFAIFLLVTFILCYYHFVTKWTFNDVFYQGYVWYLLSIFQDLSQGADRLLLF